MSNFFSSDEFLTAYASTKFENVTYCFEIVEVDGYFFRILKVGRQHIVQLPFQDFYEPCISAPETFSSLSFLPLVSLKSVSADEWLSQENFSKLNITPSPKIDWKKFTSWSDYVSWTQKRSQHAFAKNTQYKHRRIVRQLGEVSFDFSSTDKDMLELCLDWKSSQYKNSGLADGLGPDTFNRQFFRKMFDNGCLTIATMKAGGTLLAAHIGVVWKKRFYYWVPAYDTHYKKHSAGLILLEKMIEWSYLSGHSEFDFLSGGEPYKFNYATDVRLVESIGVAPIKQRMWKKLRSKLIVHVRKQERLYRLAQKLKRDWLSKKLKY